MSTFSRLPGSLSNAAATIADACMEVAVVPSFTSLGYRVRKDLFDWQDDFGDQRGTTVVLTGASSGLGLETARTLVAAGCDVLLVARSEEKLAAICEDLSELPGSAQYWRCDMSSLTEVRALAEHVLATFDHLDVLIHNAGALVDDYRRTPEGLEETYAAHVVGPFLLTQSLLPLLQSTPNSRVVFVTSGGMYTERLQPNTVEFTPDNFDGLRAYARAKRAQVALTQELAQRYPDVSFAAMHPGWADTPGVVSSLPTFHRVMGPLLRSPAEGADTIVWLSLRENLDDNGALWLDRRTRSRHKLPWTLTSQESNRDMYDKVSYDAGVSNRNV